MTIQALNPESVVERMIIELNANPEARRLLLRALLTDEFLKLPAKVDMLMELPAKVDMLMELPARVERIEEDVFDLKVGQAELRAGQSRIEGHIGNLRGEAYERRMIRCIVQTAFLSWGMDEVEVLIGDRPDRVAELASKVRKAARRGLITRERGDELLLADAVVSGTRESDGSPVHAVAEISITIGETDVTRAAERAATLSAVMGEPAMGAVIGGGVSDPDRRRAERSDVIVTIIRP